MPRQARRKSESGIYHVMLRGVNQQQIFREKEDYEKFVGILKICKAICEYRLYAYCLMGNHVHLLIQETNIPIDQIMKRITTKFVYWYNLKYQRAGHLFQDRFKSEPVETDEYLFTVIRYIHQNPVKAGLCRRIDDYKYSSYEDFFGFGDFVDSKFIFDMVSKEDFRSFNIESVNENCLDIEERHTFRVTDEQAQKIIEKYSKCKIPSDFQMLSEKLKEKYIRKFYDKGISIRQMVRLCGEHKSAIEKMLK